MKYTPTIGLEIHAELRTASKMFCSCKNDPDEERANSNVCPICLGHPGTLPVLNREAIRHVLKVGTAVGGQLADFTEWDRKNYFYPDIPKGYQISQYKYPLVSDGELAGVALERIHLEEDTARSTHDIEVGPRGGTPRGPTSLVDFNRSGVPLMELVTKPVIHDAETAVRFAKELQLLLRALGAGDANMEKGEMRVEANVSVSKIGEESPRSDLSKTTDSRDEKNVVMQSDRGRTSVSPKLGTKTEVKNLNSFKAVERAIEYEITRQTSLLEKGEPVVQETRGWDDSKSETYSQRSKESSHDYRYFPDPDIPKMKLSEIPEFSVGELKKDMPELPWAKRDRFKKDFGMTDKEVAVFVENDFLSAYFDQTIKVTGTDKKVVRLVVNYLLTDYIALLKSKLGASYSLMDSANAAHIKPELFAELIQMITRNEVSSSGAKKVLSLMIDEAGASPKALAEKHGLIQKSDASDISPIIEKIIADNSKVAAEYKAGKVASLQFLIGQAMKAAKGSANPEVVKKLLIEKLG
jgi:aspartyl-tRNA(Asn)/glutamyl-tRNA(Gln) amidotransferase subunit B